MARIQRISRETSPGPVKGQGSTFLIPADILPDGIQSGGKYKFILIGTVSSLDESGAVQRLDSLEVEKIDNDEPIGQRVQESAEEMLGEANKKDDDRRAGISIIVKGA